MFDRVVRRQVALELQRRKDKGLADKPPEPCEEYCNMIISGSLVLTLLAIIGGGLLLEALKRVLWPDHKE